MISPETESACGKGKGIRETRRTIGTASIQTAVKGVLRSAGHATKYAAGRLSPRITEDTSATVPRGKTRNSSLESASKVQECRHGEKGGPSSASTKEG